MRIAEKAKNGWNRVKNFPKGHPKVWISLVMAIMLLLGGGVGVLLCCHVIPEVKRYLSFNKLDAVELSTQDIDWEAIRETGANPCDEGDCVLPEVGTEIPDRRWLYSKWRVYDSDYNFEINTPGLRETWMEALRTSVAAVEVEYKHFRAVREVQELNGGEIKTDAWVLAECRILRRIASRDGELGKSQLQSGRDIVVLMQGSTQVKVEETPVLRAGDRAVLLIADSERPYASNRQDGLASPAKYYAGYTSEFYIPVDKDEAGCWTANCIGLKKHLAHLEDQPDPKQMKEKKEREGKKADMEEIKSEFWRNCSTLGFCRYPDMFPEEMTIALKCRKMLNRMKISDHPSMADLGRWFDQWFREIPLYSSEQPYNDETKRNAHDRVREVFQERRERLKENEEN